MAHEARFSAPEIPQMAALIERLAEQALESGHLGNDAELATSWSELEHRLLHTLRAEERITSAPGADPLVALQAIGENECIRNLTWEVSISLENQSPHVRAMRKLAQRLRARAEGRGSLVAATASAKCA